MLGGLSRAREARLEEPGRGGGRWPRARPSGHPGVGVAGPGQPQRGLSGPLLVFTGAWKRAGLLRGRERGKLKSKNKNKVPSRARAGLGGGMRGAVTTAAVRSPRQRGGGPRPRCRSAEGAPAVAAAGGSPGPRRPGVASR